MVGTPTYQWKRNGVNINGETGATLDTHYDYYYFGQLNTVPNSHFSLGYNDSISVVMTSNVQCANPSTLTSASVIPISGQVYVNEAVSASGNGRSWATAFKTLNEALSACSVTEVWVAKGTYKPTTANGDRSISFSIPSGVKVYGGFAGTETLLTDRNMALMSTTNKTTLSGDLNGNDSGFNNNGENSHTVVIFRNVSNTTLLDGFTVTGGKDGNGYGGGIGNYNDNGNNIY